MTDQHALLPPLTPWYGLLMLLGIAVSAVLWSRMFRGRPELAVVYIAGLVGALVGAKIGFVFAELPGVWRSEHFWMELAVGKTVLGALPGGYVGVELGKRLVGYRAATGDSFALVVPVGLVLGRVGCMIHGCCLGLACETGRWWTVQDGAGLPRWPAPMVEAGFNAVAAVALFLLWRRGVWRGQLFHAYLLAYGAFRLLHEPLRATPKWFAGVSPYQLIALGIIVFAVVRWRQRSGPSRGLDPATAAQSRACDC